MKRNWKDIALDATRGGKFGAILRCVFDRNDPGVVPAFTGKASITSDGFCMCTFIDRQNQTHFGALVGDWDDVLTNVHGIAKHLGLDEKEKSELFEAFANWIAQDYRSLGDVAMFERELSDATVH